jgi:hypothetical protein
MSEPIAFIILPPPQGVNRIILPPAATPSILPVTPFPLPIGSRRDDLGGTGEFPPCHNSRPTGGILGFPVGKHPPGFRRNDDLPQGRLPTPRFPGNISPVPAFRIVEETEIEKGGPFRNRPSPCCTTSANCRGRLFTIPHSLFPILLRGYRPSSRSTAG